MVVRAGLVLALLLGAAGCKKASGSYESYYDYAEAGAGDGGGAMGSTPMASPMDDVETVSMRDEAEYEPSRREKRAARRADVASSAAPEAPPAPPGTSAPAPAVTPSDGEAAPEPAVADDDQTKQARHIIYTATMQVSVFNLEDAKTKAEALPERYGGFVQNMSGSYFVMRIPSVKLRPAMDELAALGVVDNRTLDAQDVTEEYLDIETRIEVLEVTQKQMMELLTKARTVQEALEVRKALDQITMELEVLKGRLRRLESLVSYSTLTINLVERGPHTATPSSNDPFPWVDELGVEATEWK